jgi:hypothetical protein
MNAVVAVVVSSPRARDFTAGIVSAAAGWPLAAYAQHFSAQGGLDIMTLKLKPLHPVFVAEATGLDLTKLISRGDPARSMRR